MGFFYSVVSRLMPETFEKRLEHPCFPQPEDQASLVWRYIPLAKLVSLLQSSCLHLARIDLLNDPHEGSLPAPLVIARNAALQENGLEQFLPQASELSQRVRQECYVSCWALSPFESEALWRLYTSNADGVAIQTTYQALVSVVEPHNDLYVGKIGYLDYETEWFPDGNIFYPVMHKRRAFTHENEVRVLKLNDEHFTYESALGPLGLLVPIELESLIQAIYINPYAQPWYAEAVEAVVDKFAPALRSRIHWSRMKNEPLY